MTEANRFACRTIVAAAALAVCSIGTSPAQVPADPADVTVDPDNNFAKRLDRLLRTRPDKASRDELAQAGEQLLADFPKHEQRAKVMIRLAQLHGYSNSESGVKPRHRVSLAWYRRVFDAARPGSQTWSNTSIHFGQLAIGTFPDDRDLMTEVRLALERVSREADSFGMRILAELQLIRQSEAEHNPLAAELHAKRALEKGDAFLKQDDLSDKDRRMVRGMMDGASVEIMNQVGRADATGVDAPASMLGTKESRRAYVEQLVSEYPSERMEKSAGYVLAQIDEAPPRRPSLSRTKPAEMASNSSGRGYLLAINIAVVLGLGVLLVYRRKQAA